MPNRTHETVGPALRAGRGPVPALCAALCVALCAAVLALLAGAGTATAQPPDPCPPGAPIAVCDPATGQPGDGPTASPAPGGNVPDGCFPGSVDPACRTSGGSAATASPTCTGLSCIPQSPTTPGPTPGGPPAGPGAAPAAAQCGIFDLNACIDGFFRWIVGSALNPLLDLVSATLLTTPTIESMPRVAQLWDTSWQVLLACYALLVLIAGVVLMAYETLQTRYTIKEIAPRLVVGFLAGALSLWVAARGIDLANGLSAAVAGDDVDAASAGATLRAITQNSLTGSIAILLMGLVLAVMVVVLLLTYIVRVALTVLLVAGAPLALMFHALPQTEGIARWWWKAFAATLAIQVGQSLALITSIKVFLAPGGLDLFGNPTGSGLINLLVAIALVYVLIKIPFWMLSTIRGGGGRSLIGSLARGFIAYKTFGLLGGRGGRQGGRGPTARPGRNDGSSDNPYARVRATSDGQYMLPLGDLKRRPRPAPGVAMPSTTPRGRHPEQGRQLSLPLWDDWPENKPVLTSQGQYRLPIDVKRRPVAPPPPEPPKPRPTGPRPVQLQLDLFGQGPQSPQQRRTPDPYVGTRFTASGQYVMPLEVKRVPLPAPAPAVPRPLPLPPHLRPKPPPRPRQLHLPLEMSTPPTGRPAPAQTPPAQPPSAAPRRRPRRKPS